MTFTVWCFFSGDLKRGEFGPVAMKTTLGWVLSGPLLQEQSFESEVNLTTCHTLRLDTLNPCSIIEDEKNRQRSTSARNEEILGVREHWRGIKRSICT